MYRVGLPCICYTFRRNVRTARVCVGRPPVYCIYVNCVVPLTTTIVYFVRSRRRVSSAKGGEYRGPKGRGGVACFSPPHQLGDVGERCNLPSGVWVEPKPKLDLVHFNPLTITFSPNVFGNREG